MKFFIPGIDDREQEQRILEAIRINLAEEGGSKLSNRKIFSLHYIHERKKQSAQVGMLSSVNHEQVKAILDEPGRKLYNVCTNNRGVIRGTPILIGYDEVQLVFDFD
jgi:hypothetical protein